MAGGAGALGFGGGFAKGLAGIFMQKRQTDREDAARKDDQRFRSDSMALPIYLKHGEETGDFTGAEEILYRWHPDLEKKFKKEGSPFQVLGPLLSNARALEGQPGTPPAGTTSPELEQEPQPPLIPTRVAGVPPEPQKTFLGMPVLTPEQRQERADESSDPATRMRLAQRYAKANGVPLEEAMDRFGLREFAGSGASTIRYGGTVAAEDLPDGTIDSFGRPTVKGEFYRIENLPDGSKRFVPTVTPGMTSAGTEFERAAQLAGYRRFADVPPEKRAEVEASAKKLATGFAGDTSKARVEGAGQGKMNVPADLSTAQTTGVPVGTTATDVAGQAVPTQAVNERRRSVETLKTALEDLVDPKQDYLSVLPKKGELGDLAPGAAIAFRKRNPGYRDAYAKLDAKIQSIVNVMARAVGEQKGAQTEQDALRAEAAIVQLRDSLTTGDTQESARIRIAESIKTIESILAKLPAPPTPKKGAAATPGATPGGVTMKDGKLYINGVLIPGQK